MLWANGILQKKTEALSNFKGSMFFKNRHLIIQERFNKLIYGINTLIYGIKTVCMVVNPITVNNFASLFNCTPAG